MTDTANNASDRTAGDETAQGACALSVTEEQLSLIMLAAVKFAAPQRGNAASRAVVDAVVANRAALGARLRGAMAAELRANAYTSGDPWTDMDSAWLSEAADLVGAE